jgi:hypothetical protein
LPLSVRGAWAIFQAAATQYALVVRLADTALIGLLIEGTKSLYHFVEQYRSLRARRTAQMRSSLQRAGIRGPRREDCPFFVECQIRIVNDVGRMLESVGGMQ